MMEFFAFVTSWRLSHRMVLVSCVLVGFIEEKARNGIIPLVKECLLMTKPIPGSKHA